MRFICFLVGSGCLIGMMLLVRGILRNRIPPGVLYALWLVPAVRLLFPFALIPVPVLPAAAGEVRVFDGSGEVTIADLETVADHARDTGTVGIRGGEVKAEKLPNHKRTGIFSWLPYIWSSGSILCGGYVIFINWCLKRSIKQMRRLPEKRLVPVYIRNEAVSPCLFGFFNPCILLSEQTAKNRELCCQALLHEETHYRQNDHIWTAFRIFLCVIYWWNPLIWLAAACAREDAEFACDARALKGAALSEKKVYGYALLEIVQGVQEFGRLAQGITPVSGNGKNMKRRLENIVSENKRTKLWPLSVCLLLVMFLCGLCFPAQRAKAAVGESEPLKMETDIRLHPQEHREGYREPNLSYTASAGWLTDLAGRQEEQEKIKNLARRALRELYDLTGYQAEDCFYGYNEIGMLFFARSEEDMEQGRVFYSYSMGEKDGYGSIPSIDIASAKRVWYSDVQQLALPENAESMGKEELAVWFLEHSPLCPEGMVEKIEPVFESGTDCLKVTMEDGTFYEIGVDMGILAINSIYGPYPEDAQH